MIPLLQRLFARKTSLIGTRVHAWHFSEYGRVRIEGVVVDEDESSYYLDISQPERQEFRTPRVVWKHDTRPLDQALPEYGPETGEGT